MRTERIHRPQNKHRRALCSPQNCLENHTKWKYCLEHSDTKIIFVRYNSGIHVLITKKKKKSGAIKVIKWQNILPWIPIVRGNVTGFFLQLLEIFGH